MNNKKVFCIHCQKKQTMTQISTRVLGRRSGSGPIYHTYVVWACDHCAFMFLVDTVNQEAMLDIALRDSGGT